MRVMTSRNMKKRKKSIYPVRMRRVPVKIVVATPSRIITLAALTKIPVDSSPRIIYAVRHMKRRRLGLFGVGRRHFAASKEQRERDRDAAQTG